MSFKPTVPNSIGGQRHKRPGEVNQQVARAVRPQLPRDGSADGQNHISGKMPSGFIGVWIFLHSPSILAGFEAKYSRQRPALPICPNLDCRAVLSGPNQECVRCNQDFVEATIFFREQGSFMS